MFQRKSSSTQQGTSSPTRLNVKRKCCSQELTIHTIQGKLLGHGRIIHFSPTMTLRIGCLHTEKISFMVLEGSTADIILGCPWMSQQEPKVNWNTGEILQWSEPCHQNCLSPVLRTSILRSQCPSSSDQPVIPFYSTSIESPETKSKVKISLEYRAWIPGCVQQAVGYSTTTTSAMGLCH